MNTVLGPEEISNTVSVPKNHNDSPRKQEKFSLVPENFAGRFLTGQKNQLNQIEIRQTFTGGQILQQYVHILYIRIDTYIYGPVDISKIFKAYNAEKFKRCQTLGDDIKQ